LEKKEKAYEREGRKMWADPLNLNKVGKRKESYYELDHNQERKRARGVSEHIFFMTRKKGGTSTELREGRRGTERELSF